jgi:hypothetical protein
MRDLTRENKRCIPTGGFQNLLDAHAVLAADAKMEGEKRWKNLTRG